MTILIIISTILASVLVYQSIKLKKLEQKTLDSFRVVCKKLKAGEK